MKTETKTRTQQILQVMYVLSWIAFIGLLVNTGAILFSYVMSAVRPDAEQTIYGGVSLHNVRGLSFLQYTQTVSFLVAFSGMKAYVFYLVIKALSKVNLQSPFTAEVAQLLEKISYTLLGIWLIATLHNPHIEWLMKRTTVTLDQLPTEGFFLMAGLVFIIAQLFKRGVEIQSENELTV